MITFDTDRELIHEAISIGFGGRCPEFDGECWTCRAWAEFDRIYEPQAEVTPPSVQSRADHSPSSNSFAGTEGDEGQHPISNPACTASRQADEGSSNPRLTRAAPLHTSPEGPFHSITDWEDEDQ